MVTSSNLTLIIQIVFYCPYSHYFLTIQTIKDPEEKQKVNLLGLCLDS